MALSRVDSLLKKAGPIHMIQGGISSSVNDIPDSYLIQIGRIIIEWAYFEEKIDHLLYNLKKREFPKSTKKGVYGSFGQRKKELQKTIKSSKYINGEIKKKADDFLEKINEIKDSRDYVAHGFWFGDAINEHAPFTYYLMSMKRPDNIIAELNSVKDVDLKKLAERIIKLAWEMTELSHQLMPEEYRKN